MMQTHTEESEKPPVSRVRMALLKRLIDAVAMPATRIPAQDRSLVGDILIDMLVQATDTERSLCAERLKDTVEAPRRLMRYLAQCRFDVAKPLLTENKSFDPSDLVYLVHNSSVEHQRAIAARKLVPFCVSDALIEQSDISAVRVLVSNKGAELSELAMDKLIILSQENDDLCAKLASRQELKPGPAMAMFWWSDAQTRKQLLTRQAAGRAMIIELCSDLFSQFTPADWEDPVARKTIQMIERRQRNRQALARSEYESLEELVSAAAVSGMTPELMTEIGYLAGMKPISTAKLISDIGGEGLAVLCKATGLKREKLVELWRALRRPIHVENDASQLDPQLTYVIEVFDVLSVVKAQTVLRYWNWSLTSAGMQAQTQGTPETIDSFSSSHRTRKMVFNG